MTNAWDGTPISTFVYTNDAAGRRVGRIDSSVTTNVFGYNVRSEVTDAMMGTNQFGYEYDPIGNRVAATNNAQALSYVANELNQYTSISNGVPVAPVHDDDGNMVEYGDWAFTWNGENRLIGATNAVHGVGYEYDFMGRMARKVSGGAATEFVWDEFNIIAEIEDSDVRFNIWGLDLSQTPQGAGGVGGLIAVVHGESSLYSTCYDANGNITEYLDADGAIVARRDYGPFGETLSLTGSLSAAFTHWWSTKPWDPATGFSEYEFRMYSPELGRWVSRDLIGERGGLAIYVFILNSAVQRIDYIGFTGLSVDPSSSPANIPWTYQDIGVPPMGCFCPIFNCLPTAHAKRRPASGRASIPYKYVSMLSCTIDVPRIGIGGKGFTDMNKATQSALLQR